MAEISVHIEDVDCNIYVGHPLVGYSVTVTPDKESENVWAEFKGPTIDGGSVIKKDLLNL